MRQKREIAEVLGVEGDTVRVVSKDVGGNFGTRNRLYVEFPLVGWASLARLGAQSNGPVTGARLIFK